jgi:hypothetical protein
MGYEIVLTQRNLIETIIEGDGIAGAKPSLPIYKELVRNQRQHGQALQSEAIPVDDREFIIYHQNDTTGDPNSHQPVRMTSPRPISLECASGTPHIIIFKLNETRRIALAKAYKGRRT